MDAILGLAEEFPAEKLVLGHNKAEKALKEQVKNALTEEGTVLKYAKILTKDEKVIEFKGTDSQLKRQVEQDRILNSIDEGSFYSPMIFTIRDKESVLMQEETFGPVISLFSISSKHEAVEVCNNTKYGLAASLFTKNKQLQEDMIKAVDVGMLFINKIPVSMSEVPWGGMKSSGFGRDCSIHGLEQFTSSQIVLFEN